MKEAKLLTSIGGAGKSRLPTSFLKHKKEKQTNHIIFFTDDEDNNDEQIRSNNS